MIAGVKDWLDYMPPNMKFLFSFDRITDNIYFRINNSEQIIQLLPNIYKIQGKYVSHYWIQHEAKIILGIELQHVDEGLVVTLVGKKQLYKNKTPFASELYRIILNDNKSAKIFSDTVMNIDGLNIWKRLINSDNVFVFDKKNQKILIGPVLSPNDLDKFVNADTGYKNYQFVLTK